MKSRFEKMQELRVFWYRDVGDYEYWKNLWKKF